MRHPGNAAVMVHEFWVEYTRAMVGWVVLPTRTAQHADQARADGCVFQQGNAAM